jgi:hypothetical protein
VLQSETVMISDKQIEIVGLGLLIVFFCVLIPALFIIRGQATRKLRLLLIDNLTPEGLSAALARKRRVDRALSIVLSIAVAFVLFGMIFGT